MPREQREPPLVMKTKRGGGGNKKKSRARRQNGDSLAKPQQLTVFAFGKSNTTTTSSNKIQTQSQFTFPLIHDIKLEKLQKDSSNSNERLPQLAATSFAVAYVGTELRLIPSQAFHLK